MALSQIQHHLIEGFSKGDSFIHIALDMEKAFDSVWHARLIHICIEHNFPLYLVKWLHSFLRDRVSIIVKDGK